MGLGVCWGHIYERMQDDKKTAKDYVRELLGIPKHIRILCIIGIGIPLKKTRAQKRRNNVGEGAFK